MEGDIPFDEQVRDHQIEWRHNQGTAISKKQGKQNGVPKEWILPVEERGKALWRGIAGDGEKSLADYLKHHPVKEHTGTHNLKSSWVMCVNLYFSFRDQPDLLAEFLRETIDSRILKVEQLELEYEDDDPKLKPVELLNEPDEGGRGSGQTSPDMGVVVSLRGGTKGLILVENKYTEHSFYPCSGLKKEKEKTESWIPEEYEQHCGNFKVVLSNPSKYCWQCNWAPVKKKNRKYWDYLLPVIDRELASKIKMCLAKTSGYQLFRQQALAEGIAKYPKRTYSLVVSCVAYDGRNKSLENCLKGTGLNWREDWAKLFGSGEAKFAYWTHQEWVSFVTQHKNAAWQDDWLKYVGERYKL